MATLCAILGILGYYLGNAVGSERVAGALTIAAVVGALFLIAATRLGASRPPLTAAAFQGSVLLPVALGAAISSAAIWVTAWVIVTKGEHPMPSTEAITSAAMTVIGLISDRLLEMSRFRPSHVAAVAVKWRYSKQFPKLYGNDSSEYRNAYNAINQDVLADAQGELCGWGFQATMRRLELIRKGL